MSKITNAAVLTTSNETLVAKHFFPDQTCRRPLYLAVSLTPRVWMQLARPRARGVSSTQSLIRNDPNTERWDRKRERGASGIDAPNIKFGRAWKQVTSINAPSLRLVIKYYPINWLNYEGAFLSDHSLSFSTKFVAKFIAFFQIYPSLSSHPPPPPSKDAWYRNAMAPSSKFPICSFLSLQLPSLPPFFPAHSIQPKWGGGREATRPQASVPRLGYKHRPRMAMGCASSYLSHFNF